MSAVDSQALLSGMNHIARLHGAPFDAFGLSSTLIGKTSGLKAQDALKLFRTQGMDAYLLAPARAAAQVHPCLLFAPDGTFTGVYLPEDGVLMPVNTANPNGLENNLATFPKGSLAIAVPPPSAIDAAPLAWFWTPLKGMAGLHSELLLCCLFINLFSLTLPLFSMTVYDRVLPTFATATLWSLSAGAIMVLFLDLVFRVVRAALLAQAQQKIGQEQDEALLEKFLRQRGTPKDTGERMESFHVLAHARDEVLMHILPSLADVPFILLFLFLIFNFSPVLTLVPVVMILLVWLVQAAMVPGLVSLAYQRLKATQQREGLLHGILAATINLRLVGATGRAMYAWRQKAGKLFDIGRHGFVWQQTGQGVAYTLAQLTSVFILMLGTFQVNAGNLTVGGLIACSILASRALAPALHLADSMGKLQRVKASLRELHKVSTLPLEETVTNSDVPEVPLNVQGRLTTRNLTCTYPSLPRAAIENVSLDIQPGERIGIVGRNGAGKSTFAATLAGLTPIASGQVLLDGLDTARMATTVLRSHLAYVPQTVFFPSGTLGEIVALGDATPDEKRLHQAASLSGLEGMMAYSGLGLSSHVGENATNLSSGQRQMLGLAQAFYRQPRILVLDEPTSHFDNELEAQVKTNLKNWLDASGSTFILISHRVGLLDLVDRVLVMDAGRVVMDGPRNQILKQLQGGAV